MEKKFFNYKLFHDALARKNLTESSFSELSEIGKSTINNWKNVKNVKNPGYILKLETILGIKYDDLCVPEEEVKKHPITLQMNGLALTTPEKMQQWPIIGNVAGGPWIAAIESTEYTNYAESYMPVSASIKDPNGYALTVVGDSMAPVIPEGTEIAVSPCREVCNGDIAVLFIKNDLSPYLYDVCIKKFYWHGPNNEEFRIVSYNPAYEEKILPSSLLTKMQKVVQWRCTVK